MASSIPPAGGELLDDLGAPADQVRQSLGNIARANRLFGGTAAVRFGLDRLLGGQHPARLLLLDVGTGSGDVPRALVPWFRRRGTALQAVGIERHPVAAMTARESGLETVIADGLRLPMKDDSVDVALMSQVAHHFPPNLVSEIAKEASRVARIGVVIADLRPSRSAAWGFRLASRVLGFDPATRTDGLVSLERGFTRPALTELLEMIGASPVVENRPGARIVAYWKTS